MSTSTDLTALQASLATAFSKISSAVNAAYGLAPAVAQNAVAALYAVAEAQTAATALAADLNPPPPPPPPPTGPLTLAALTPVHTTVGTTIAPITLSATGGPEDTSYTYTATGLPAGLSLVGSAIRGAPTAVGTSTATITVTDGAGDTTSTALVVTVIAAPAPTAVVLGAYCGAGTQGIAGVKAFGTEAGAPMHIVSTYCDGTSWTSIEEGDWDLSQYKGSGLQLVIGVNVYCGNGNQKTDLAAGATGAHNATYAALAQNLIAAGQANAILRIGWEPDVNIFSNDDTTSAQNYAKFFQQIRNTMSAVAGAAFTYSWYFGSQFDDATIAACYPGDAYADCIEFDPYDQSWQGSPCSAPYNGTAFTQAQHQCIWANDQLPRLERIAAFAKTHVKPLCYGEYGVIDRSDGHGGGDDPYWITDFLNWVKANNVMWASYFNANSGGNSILADYPNALAAFKAEAAQGI